MKLTIEPLIFKNDFYIVINANKVKTSIIKNKSITSKKANFDAGYMYTITILKIYMRIKINKSYPSVLKYKFESRKNGVENDSRKSTTAK